MKNILTLILFNYLIINLSTAQNRPIGTNLAGISDWSSELTFVDLMKSSRNWINHEGSGSSWSSGVSIPLDSNGYPFEIPYNNGINPPQYTRTILLHNSLQNLYPSGNYRLIVNGTGKIRFWNIVNLTISCPIDTFIYIDNSTANDLFLEIEESNVNNHINEINFIMPSHANSYLSQPFHPELIKFTNNFQTVRFMDKMRTNETVIINWEDRSTTTDFTQALNNGIAYEYIIEYCNANKVNPWICIPHQATDQFIINFAQLFRDNLDSDLKVYVEYSNEVWNSIFPANTYVNNMGANLGYSGNPWEQGWKYYAKRCADIFSIFENEYTDNNRFVKVISSQAANDWLSNQILIHFNDPIYNPNQITADAFAIAPYFGGGIADDIGNANLINSITVANIIDSLTNSMNQSFSWIDNQNTVANNHNLDLIAYEGGQHLVTYNYNNDNYFVSLLADVNRHPDMENLYCQMFDYWYSKSNTGLFCNFSSHGNWGTYGYWGVKENYSDTLSPKYLGLTNCVFNYNPISAITNLSIKKKELFKIVDLLGRETTPKNNALLFYIYNDGTVEKKIIVE